MFVRLSSVKSTVYSRRKAVFNFGFCSSINTSSCLNSREKSGCKSQHQASFFCDIFSDICRPPYNNVVYVLKLDDVMNNCKKYSRSVYPTINFSTN